VKEEYTITIFILFMKIRAHKNMVSILKNNWSLRRSLHHYYRISCETYTAICITCVVVVHVRRQSVLSEVQVAIQEDILAFISYVCVTYTMKGIMCAVVVK
jgi:hypothetical protein